MYVARLDQQCSESSNSGELGKITLAGDAVDLRWRFWNALGRMNELLVIPVNG